MMPRKRPLYLPLIETYVSMTRKVGTERNLRLVLQELDRWRRSKEVSSPIELLKTVAKVVNGKPLPCRVRRRLGEVTLNGGKPSAMHVYIETTTANFVRARR